MPGPRPNAPFGLPVEGVPPLGGVDPGAGYDGCAVGHHTCGVGELETAGDPGPHLLLAGRIYSPTTPDATAMVVENGLITWIGSDRVGRALHPTAREFDLEGAFVAPAFVDAHVHTTDHGLSRLGLDLSVARSREECLELVRAACAASDDPIVWGQGWDESAWPQPVAPTSAELDAIGGGRAIYLARIDAHSAVADSGLYRAAGLAEPDGPVIGDDHHLVRTIARERLGRAGRDRARRRALDDFAARGIAVVHECGGPQIGGRTDALELLALEHGVERRLNWGEAVDSADAATALIADLGAHALAGDLFIDGSIGSRTAALRDDYCAGGRGIRFLDVDTVTAHLRACTLAGIQAGFHAIGDRALDTVAAGLRTVADELGGPAVAALGHRIEHAEMLDPETIDLCARLGVITSVQPIFDELWGGPDGMYAERLGAQRAATMNPFSRMAAAGVSLAFGSDAPVTPPDPWRIVRAAVHHHTDGFGISPRAAFAAATRGAWRAGGVRDGIAGTLVPGAPASYAIWDVGDLVVASAADTVQRWSTDPRSRVPGLPALDADAPDPVCLRTVHRGEVVYSR